MNKPNFEYEVRELIDTPLELYKAAGIDHNPFYYFRTENPVNENIREEAYNYILDNSNHGAFLYLSGDLIGGSGKSYFLNLLFSELSAKKNVAVIMLRDIVRYRLPMCAIDIVLDELDFFFEKSAGVEKYCLLDEVEFNEIYSRCCLKSDRVVGAGHYLYRDAGKFKDKFVDIDIDRKWLLEYEDIFNHLSELVLNSASTSILKKTLLQKIAKNSPTIGIAETICGLLLATKARRINNGNNADVGEIELQFWLNMISTNWFWFSMDCWRVRNPLEMTLLKSINGKRSDIFLSIQILGKQIKRIEKN